MPLVLSCIRLRMVSNIELAVLGDLISTLGLPVALVVILIFVIYQMGKRMNDQADKNMERVQARCKEREEALMVEIRENREVNEKAIETIARYSEKLDNIQADVKEIKQDMSLIMIGGNKR